MIVLPDWCLGVCRVEQGRVTGAMGVPVPQHSPGDCYMWGAVAPRPAHPDPSWTYNSSPVLVPNTTHLDIHQVTHMPPACAGRPCSPVLAAGKCRQVSLHAASPISAPGTDNSHDRFLRAAMLAFQSMHAC